MQMKKKAHPFTDGPIEKGIPSFAYWLICSFAHYHPLLFSYFTVSAFSMRKPRLLLCAFVSSSGETAVAIIPFTFFKV